MNDLTEDEARKILLLPKFCYDAPDWVPVYKTTQDKKQNKKSSGYCNHQIECGLLDEQGQRTKLHIQLNYKYSNDTKITTYQFMLFERDFHNAKRVYKLLINNYPIILSTNSHNFPHERIGDFRKIGDVSWLNWSFNNAILHFAKTINLTFIPTITDPEQLILK